MGNTVPVALSTDGGLGFHIIANIAKPATSKTQTSDERRGLFRSVDQHSEAEVRYDPRDPSKFALAWAVERSGSRWLSVIFLWGILALAGVLMGWLGSAMAGYAGLIKTTCRKCTPS